MNKGEKECRHNKSIPRKLVITSNLFYRENSFFFFFFGVGFILLDEMRRKRNSRA